MDNANFQQESHNLDNQMWKPLAETSPLVDPDLYFDNADNATGILDAQSFAPLSEELNHVVNAVDWKSLGDAQFSVYPSVSMEAGAQELYTPHDQINTHPILSTSDTFAENIELQNTRLEDDLRNLEDTDFQFQANYTYPDPSESAMPIYEPYFTQASGMSPMFQPTDLEDRAGPLTSGLDFETFGSLGPGNSTAINAQLDAPFYGSDSMSFGHDRTLKPSFLQHMATLDDPNSNLISSFARQETEQIFQAQPNSLISSSPATTRSQYTYNPTFESYSQLESPPSEAATLPIPSNHYSPNSWTSSPYFAGHTSASPSQDQYEDSDSEYSEEQDSRPKRTVHRRVIARKGSKEKPKIPIDKPWIRINKETRGGTSRTLKINNYNPDEMYEQLSHPIGPWSAGHSKRRFEYTSHHELADREMTIARLKQFIQSHPRTDDCKLTLYIQRTPADSKRRYGSDQTERCRFEDCPARVYGKSVASRGLITPGNYRVAFDEFSYGYGLRKGSRADPFKVAFFVHLYCLERFLDFSALCRLDNVSVEADDRHAMPSEPNAKFGAALLGPELNIAANFIDACRSGHLRRPNGEWTNYPHHTKIGSEIKWKDHYDTLNYRLQNSKNTIRSSKVQRQGKLTNIAMHCGNLDVVHKAMKEIYKTPKDVPGWRYTDKHGVFTGERNDPPEGWILDPREPVKPPRPRQKRHVEELESDEEDKSEHSNKMARTGEHMYGSAEGTYEPGMEQGFVTRHDYQDVPSAGYTPAVYSL